MKRTLERSQPYGVLAVLTIMALLLGVNNLLAEDQESKEQEAEAVLVETELNREGRELLTFLEQYEEEYRKMYCDVSYSWWDAMITGDAKAFEKNAAMSLAMSTYHSDAEKFARLTELRKRATGLTKLQEREAYVAWRAFEQSQLPPDLMEKMIRMGSEIEQIFQTQRGSLDGKEYTNNELLEMLEDETDSDRRFRIWDALKQVGELVAPKLIELAKVRNEAARQLGYKNYWEMEVAFQDYDPEALTAIFDELEELTTPVFTKVKAEMDAELKEKFKVTRIMPWHYDNPFFQQAPPSKDVDTNIFYDQGTGQDIVDRSIQYYADLGIDVTPIIEKSDLFEKPGKSQHGFCNNMNGEGDVRILCNIKPTAEWMDTQLHEMGHAIYDYQVDRTLPFILRQPAHIFTTEGVAMMFGALARDPDWLVKYCDVSPKKAKEIAPALAKQRLREQLIFCRWTLVMFRFERALYENPEADLNTLWWDTVEKIQLMPRPEDRHLADWASKPHFVIAPVYYHNYMLGELFGAQLRATLRDQAGTEQEFGRLLREKVFFPGDSLPWQEFVREATGKEFSAEAFAEELK
ncbi:MAG: M2 family metallopeptidase [Planctomycetia bacterium]|nr:M2 family metallopeptidase [Planctomycetia bacterium]